MVLVRGMIISSTGDVVISELGQPDTTVAPILLESRQTLGNGNCVLKLTGDYKVRLYPSWPVENNASFSL